MSADPLERVSKLFEARSKLEGQLKKAQLDIEEAIWKRDRKVRVEKAVATCHECFDAAIAKNDELLQLAKKTEEKEKLTNELVDWVDTVTRHNHIYLEDARKYLDSPEDPTSTAKAREQLSTKSNSTSKMNSSTSKTSSQRKKDLALAKMRREEAERQCEAALRLQQVKNQLALEEIEESNRQKVAEARMCEVEMEIEAESTQPSEVASNRDFDVAPEEGRTEWVNNTSQSVHEPTAQNIGDENDTQVTGDGTVVTQIERQPTSEVVTDYESVLSSAPRDQQYPVSSRLSVHSAPTGAQLSNDPAKELEVSGTILPGRSLLQDTGSLNVGFPPGITGTIIAPPVSSAARVIPPPSQPASRHIVPNLSSWTFSKPQPPTLQVFSTMPNNAKSVSAHGAGAVPYTSGGTVYYLPRVPNPTVVQASAPFPPSTNAHPSTSVAAAISASSQLPGNNPVTLKDLAELLTISRKDPLPEWKLESYDGNPLQWHEWFGQFRSAVDSAPLSPDVKLTYLKTLVTGKAKLAIANFAYCGSMYPQALKTLERKFGQPQAVVGAHLDKLSNYPAVKMHSSESIVSYASVITSLVSVFQSLCYDSDLRSASLLNQAVSKLPPNLKEGWSLHTVKRDLLRPTLLDFDTWLQEKAEAHERMRAISKKASIEESPPVSLKKATSKVFASNTAHQKSTKVGVASETKKAFPPCVVCKGNHGLWKCTVFKEKTPTQRAKVLAENQLCFSCFNANRGFRNCPNPKKVH